MLTLILKISLLIFMSGSASNTPIFDVESSSASVEIIDTLEALESRSYYEDWPCHHGNPYQIYDQYIAIQTDYTLPSYCPEIEGAMWVYHYCFNPIACTCTEYGAVCDYVYY